MKQWVRQTLVARALLLVAVGACAPATERARDPASAASGAVLTSVNVWLGGVRSLAPINYFDRFRLMARGLTTDGDGGIRAKLRVPAAPTGR